MNATEDDNIPAEIAVTLAGMFRERVRRTPDLVAYRQHDEATGNWNDYTWQEMGHTVARWQSALAAEQLAPGDRVAVLMRNCVEWVQYEQAALGCGLVVVPLYTDDRAENIAYILNDAGAKVIFLQGSEHWERLLEVHDQLGGLQRILTLEPVKTPAGEHRVRTVADWLPDNAGGMREDDGAMDDLATIVYTSGTTGRPKGVMLSHGNILRNTDAALDIVMMRHDDLLLSFLPLSHTFERTVGYYIPMKMGSTVAYARSIPQLGEDLQTIRPTLLISVPRIYERVYNKIQTGLAEKSPTARRLFELAVEVGWQRFEHRQGRAGWSPKFLLWPILNKLVAGKIMARLGGRMRLAASGGAPLPPSIAKVFIGLGLNLIQGYGLTETSPIISGNPPEDNDPASVGIPLTNVEVKVGENDELLTRGPCVMLGYWNNEQATRDIIDDEGWLHTGDKVRIENNHIYITGRLKEIIVLANGEKVPPTDMEMSIALDTLFEQVMVIGDNRPFLTAVIVFEPEQWQAYAPTLGVDPNDPAALVDDRLLAAVKQKVDARLSGFPGYAQVHNVTCTLDAWTVDNGMITPTLKLKRRRILDTWCDQIEQMYAGH